MLNFNNNALEIGNDKKTIEKVELLTKREKQVLVTLSNGNSTKDNADILNISSQTVEKHKQNIREKLNLRTVAEMINFTMTSKLYSL